MKKFSRLIAVAIAGALTVTSLGGYSDSFVSYAESAIEATEEAVSQETNSQEEIEESLLSQDGNNEEEASEEQENETEFDEAETLENQESESEQLDSEDTEEINDIASSEAGNDTENSDDPDAADNNEEYTADVMNTASSDDSTESISNESNASLSGSSEDDANNSNSASSGSSDDSTAGGSSSNDAATESSSEDTEDTDSDGYKESYDLVNFLTEGYVDVDGELVSVHQFSFKPGQKYTLTLVFGESDYQFGKMDGTNYLYYNLPDGVVSSDIEVGGKFDFIVSYEGKNYTLDDNYYYLENNVLKVVINNECIRDGVNVYDLFQETVDAEFKVVFGIQIAEDASDIVFSDDFIGTVDTTDDDEESHEDPVIDDDPQEEDDDDDDDGTSKINVKKTAVEVSDDNTQATWTITIDVPAEGLSSLIVEDNLPIFYYGSEVFKDTYAEIVSVEGLVDGEQYTSKLTERGNYTRDILTLTFYKDADKTEKGLNATDADRQIVITLKTDINQDWVESKNAKHTNSVVVTAKDPEGNKKTGSSSDYVNVYSDNHSMAKNFHGSGRTSDGRLYYSYFIILTNVNTDSITISDYYDTELFDVLDTSVIVSGGTNITWPYSELIGKTSTGNVTVSEELDGDGGYEGATGHVDITVSGCNISDEDGKEEYYPYYMVQCALVVEDMQLLNERANGSTIDADGETVPGMYIYNTAVWNELSSTNKSGKYVYSGVAKELTQAPVASNGYVATFQITINPSALDLVEGTDELELIDEPENLTFILSSVKVVNGSGEDITSSCNPSLDGEKLVMTIPDAQKVIITYDAEVIESGTYSNTVSLLSYSSKISESCVFSSEGTGSASVKSLDIYKCDKEDSGVALEGAVFGLYKKNGTEVVAVTDKDGNAVTVTTDATGKATIRGKYTTDGWALTYNTQYYLKELTAPAGYVISTELIPFTIVKDSQTADSASYTFHSADTLTITNEKEVILSIDIYKCDSSNSNKALGGAVFGLYMSSESGVVAVTDKDGNDVTVTTDSEGKATIKGDYTTDGWTLKYNTQYYLKELTAPSGYVISKELIPFTIVEDGETADSVSYVFYNADTLTITNVKKTIPTEDPDPDPEENPDPDPDDSTDTTTETAEVYGTVASVLGARRTVEEPAVLGARRSATDDTNNRAMRIVVIIAAGIAATVLILSDKKKSKRK
ncbi:MAG: hypothetical protein K6A23_12965 [Butyrivibrio sp.]|nr:hypothetical protein [Butyrivibrio sp.]